MDSTTRLRFRDYVIDSGRREVLRGSTKVHLSRKALQLLEVLAEKHPRAVSKQELFDRIWPSTYVAESNLPTLVKELRSALGDDARDAKIVRTVFGYGYALATEVVAEPEEYRPIESIAVLPFEDAHAPGYEYLGEGIAESLINALTRLTRIRVIPRSSSFRYRNTPMDLVKTGRELGTSCVVAGRLRSVGDDVAVQIELVDVRSERQLWGERFQLPAGNLIELQSMISSALSAQLERHLQTGPLSVDPPSASTDSEAWRMYLRGRHYWNRREGESFRRALESFEAAAQLDGSFALAHAAIAETYVALGTRDLLPPAETFAAARSAAQRALRISPDLAPAYTALAAVHELFDWDWNAAEELHRKAIALDGRGATSFQWFALHLARRRRHDEASVPMRRALELEPASTIINTNAALIAYLAHDIDQAIALAAAAVDLDPHYADARLVAGIALTSFDISRAIEELEEAARISQRPPYVLANLAFAYARADRVGEAQQLMREIEGGKYVSGANVALSAVGIGDIDLAVIQFRIAFEQRSPWLSYLTTDPRLAVVLGEPAMEEIIRTIGL